METARHYRSYPYSLNKSFLVFSLLLFLGGGGVLVYFGWSENQPVLYAFAVACFSLALFSWVRNSANAEIRVSGDDIVIPYGIRFQKENRVPFHSIASVEETTINSISNIRISLKSGKPILLPETLLKETHYYELLELLETKAMPKEVFYKSPVEQEAEKNKWKRLRFINIGLPVAVLLLVKLFTGQLNSVSGWLAVLGVIGLLFTLDLVGAHLAERFGKLKEIGKTITKAEAKKIKSKWQLIVYSPALVSFAFLFILVKVPHEGTTNIWPFISYSLTATFIIFLILKRFLPEVDGIVTPFEQGMAFATSGIFLGIVLVFTFIVVNINLDSSRGTRKQSFLTAMFVPDKFPNDKCFRIAHWETGEPISAGDSAYCTYAISNLKENDKVEFLVKDGFLGNPWIDDVVLVKE